MLCYVPLRDRIYRPCRKSGSRVTPCCDKRRVDVKPSEGRGNVDLSLTASWRSFRALDSSDRLLVVEAATLLPLIRAGTFLLPFPLLRRLLNCYATLKAAVDDPSI